MKEVQREVKGFQPISEREQWLTAEIVNSAIAVHRSMGPGLLAAVYEKCFCYELQKRNIPFTQQQWFRLVYGDMVIERGLQINLLADDLVIIEIKSGPAQQLLWEAQLLSHLRLTGKRLGYILNFDLPLMKDGIRRMINK
ncbi:MAG TPA: GxxExxY protein [Chitinophagaceae bacterium]|nr:GxxExxY protein [Chitinophagaceae bacterium]